MKKIIGKISLLKEAIIMGILLAVFVYSSNKILSFLGLMEKLPFVK